MSPDGAALLAFLLVASPTTDDGAPPVLEGWHDFSFGMPRRAVSDRLGLAGFFHAGAIRTRAEEDGVLYDVLLKFRADQLHEVFLHRGIAPPTVAGDRNCWDTHVAMIHSLENRYHAVGTPVADAWGRTPPDDIRQDPDRQRADSAKDYRLFRTAFRFAGGAAIQAETKFLPALNRAGLCDSTIRFTEGE